MTPALCTIAIDPSLAAGDLLEAWRALAAGLPEAALATDPRLPTGQQRLLLEEAHRGGVEVAEVALPLLGPRGRPAPRFCSPDSEERRAAKDALLDTVRLADKHQASRIIVFPELLELRWGPPTLARWFAQGVPLRLEPLLKGRPQAAAEALDQWRRGLEAALSTAEGGGLSIELLGPTIYPQQCPDAVEVAALQAEFAGAKLGYQEATDWAHARCHLVGDEGEANAAAEGPEDPPLPQEILAMLPAKELATLLAPKESEAPATPRITSRRIADACGLTLRLPPGLGQIDWQSFEDLEVPSTMVWEGSAEELRRSAKLIDLR